MDIQITIVTIVVVLLLQFIFQRRIRSGRSQMTLRPLTSYRALFGEVGRAVESGSRVHISLGQANVAGPTTPTTIAANSILESLARDGCANDTPPLVTVGEGTILTLAQDSLRSAYDQVGRKDQFDPNDVHYIASEKESYAYAGGVASEILQNKIISNVLVGRLGPELIIMAEAAERKEIGQIIGSDDPMALAVATAVSDNVLIGEQLLAADAYLKGEPGQLAALQVQDVIRWLLILSVLGYAIFEFIS